MCEMTRRQFNDYIKYELYRHVGDTGGYPSLIQRIRIKYFQPNTNCMYLCRKMWYLHTNGKKIRAKFLYLKIIRRYGCIIYPNAYVGRGFHVEHPTGIVIGKCTIGEDFTIFQNCTIGIKHRGDEARGLTPVIGNCCCLCDNSIVIGNVKIADNIIIGAASIVLNDLDSPGTYVGVPAKIMFSKPN